MRVNYANRGKYFESLIDDINDYYKIKKFGVVQKIATPMFKKDNQWVRTKSTVDYMGFLRGFGIAFDAKETKVDRWPFRANIKPHQMIHLTQSRSGGAKSFILLHFIMKRATFFIGVDELHQLFDSDLKSITYDYCLINYDKIYRSTDYLKHLVDKFK